eukprot:XP_001701384.1 predicted protein [Chlamydomonas reinhardtii]
MSGGGAATSTAGHGRWSLGGGGAAGVGVAAAAAVGSPPAAPSAFAAHAYGSPPGPGGAGRFSNSGGAAAGGYSGYSGYSAAGGSSFGRTSTPPRDAAALAAAAAAAAAAALWGPPSTLTHLNLTYTKVCVLRGTLTDAALRHVSRLSCLTALDVFGCRLTDAGAAVLGGAPALRGLRSLECCGGGITDAGALCLARLTALTSLNLSQNPRLGDAGVRSLAAHLAELQVLSLNHTNVTSACLRELAQLPWLRSLALAGSRVSEAGVARLKARAHPDLIIKHTPPPPPPGARVFA